MKSPRAYWPRWAETLRRLHLEQFAASLLEAGSPLALLGAQALYFGSVFLNDSGQALALAETLEEQDEAFAFAAFLTRETAP